MFYRLYLQGGQLVVFTRSAIFAFIKFKIVYRNVSNLNVELSEIRSITLEQAYCMLQIRSNYKYTLVFCHMLTFSSSKVFSSVYAGKLQQTFRIAASCAKFDTLD
ncbi:hypothetical protein T07_7303 [Trichinella nelsoni]|uniref:Uncharacterized protein n=1 Tax=Trichinella nelsoni TaxID=6336 RepID=A0A0V0S1I0_9BILA|nr:hypothetical protein T07_7303 [Trichinella nelsoni]